MTRRDGEGQDALSYDIRLSPDGFVECECKGYLRWQHCKHVRTLQAMGCLPTPRKEERRDETQAESDLVSAGT
jgi:hypothetical protein